jgi:hypothetical protein
LVAQTMAHALKHVPASGIRVAARPRLGARTILLSVAAASVLLAVWHYWTLFSSLSAAKSELVAIQQELGTNDLDVNIPAERVHAARDHSTRANDAVARAQLHYRWDPLIFVAGHLPLVGPQVLATGQLIDMADLAARIANAAAVTGEEFAVIRDQRTADEPLTQTLDRAINRTRGHVEEMERLTGELVAQRLAMGDRGLLGPLASAREQLDAQLPALANATTQLRQAYDVVPALLGFQGERRYLVLALNNGELLPGGGLVSAAGVLPVRDGQVGDVDFVDSTSWRRDWEAQGGSYIEPPGPLKRYLLRDYTWNLLVSDWSPDFPTWSQQALEFFELVHGKQDVDGIIAMDLEVLRSLLAITGPRTLEVEGSGPITFTSDNAVLELERLTRHSFDPTEADRKSVIGEVAQLLLTDIERTPSEQWELLVDVVRTLGTGRHIQVLSLQANEQAFIRDAGWAGELDEASPDYVQFNEASLNSTKLNLIIQPYGTYSVDVSALGDAHHELTLHYANTLLTWQQGKDPALVKQLMLGGMYGGYLRVFGPASMTRWSATKNGESASIEDAAREGSRRWFGTFTPLPAGATADVGFRWTVPLATTSPGAREYELLIQKQPGTRGMCLSLDVTRDGQPPSHLDVRGGHPDWEGRLCLSTDVRLKAVWE